MMSNFAAVVLLFQACVFLSLTRVVYGEKGTAGSNRHEEILKLYQDTAKNIDEWSGGNDVDVCSSGGDGADEKTGTPVRMTTREKIESIKHLPPEDMVGMDSDMLKLCATVAGGVYEANSKADFEKLMQDDEIQEKFPDLTVRFFQNGVTFGKDWFPEQLSLDAPTFVGLITGSTLILGWRGTATIKDVLADVDIDSVAPWRKTLSGLEVQKAYYDMVKNHYFKYHERDVQNYIKGSYSKVPGRTKKDGTPITRIILCGHSLGGGLAQVAHLYLRANKNSKNYKDIEIKTIAISAPMTTVVDNPSADTSKFLTDVVEPDMRNVVFNADVVPRGYSDLKFIDGFVNAFLKDDQTASPGLAQQLAAGFVKLHVNIFKKKGMMEQAERYRHVGKLIYYDNEKSNPVLYTDPGFYDDVSVEEKNFRDLRYGPQRKVAHTAMDNHMVLVTGPGLVYDTD